MLNYDYIVIGSGLTGLIIANKLSQETDKVLLIESEPTAGGSNKPAIISGSTIENGFRFFPGSDIAKEALTHLENQMGLKLISNVQPNDIQTYDASGFKSFVGFGDHAPEFYSQLSYFLNNKETTTTLPWHQVTQHLLENFKGTFLPKSFVTDIVIENDQVTAVEINGSKKYTAANYVFTGSVRDLIKVVSDDIINARAKAKVKKNIGWMTVCLDLCHANIVTDSENLFLLEGTTKDSIGPCIGRFTKTEDQASQISQWMGFIDHDTAEETENISEVIKKMKRQIKRAFPQTIDQIKAERLFISPPLTAGEIKTNANGTLPKAQNLWIASAELSTFPNLLGSLLQAQFTLASLGFADSETTHFVQNLKAHQINEPTINP